MAYGFFLEFDEMSRKMIVNNRFLISSKHKKKLSTKDLVMAGESNVSEVSAIEVTLTQKFF